MPDDFSRRDFAKSLATAASTLPLIAALALPAEAAEPKKDEAERLDPIRDEAALWLELIRTRYPDARMTPDVLALIAGDVLGDIMHSRKLSAFPLSNSDGPAFVFGAWTGATHAGQ